MTYLNALSLLRKSHLIDPLTMTCTTIIHSRLFLCESSSYASKAEIKSANFSSVFVFVLFVCFAFFFVLFCVLCFCLLNLPSDTSILIIDQNLKGSKEKSRVFSLPKNPFFYMSSVELVIFSHFPEQISDCYILFRLIGYLLLLLKVDIFMFCDKHRLKNYY